ncbi:hypothetical protein EJD97_003768, partial [Solanum chilense]
GSQYYTDSFIVTRKGLAVKLPRVLTTNIIIDLLRNRFEGHIPSIIVDLVGLRTLNLSHNRLEGHIPASLHQLSILESLDLSSNKISGEIPQQLASLTSLEVLNLSHNHLTIILLDASLKETNLIHLKTANTKGMMVYVDFDCQMTVVLMIR